MSFVLVVRCCHVFHIAVESYVVASMPLRGIRPSYFSCDCVVRSSHLIFTLPFSWYVIATCGVSFFVFLATESYGYELLVVFVPSCDWVVHVCFRFVYCHCVVPLRVWFVASNFRSVTVWLLLTVLLSFYRRKQWEYEFRSC